MTFSDRLYSIFGNHVGDWEHVTLRFVNLQLSDTHMEAHGARVNSASLQYTGERPIVYAALGSHGLYPDARRHTYLTLPNNDTLNDDTGQGLA